ncbi:MAG TPA: protein-L-isoaspartate(D-aspartate) O-methyltransferase [Candidatus Acidoferrum sp.]
MTSNQAQPGVLHDPFEQQRAAMVEVQIRRRGVTDERVLQVMAAVPRHDFVSSQWQSRAYLDEPVPIGDGQTISQPYIVAVMTAMLQLRGPERVLEIGTGCGYQAAVLSQLAREVHTVEYRPELARDAAQRLQALGYTNIHVHCGEGSVGLPQFAPFDAILMAAAAPALPTPLLDQIAQGGCMVAPIGVPTHQQLFFVRKQGTQFHVEHREACRFVPLQGPSGWKETQKE